MSKKLVNFRLKEEIWEQFQEKAEQEGNSASAQLRNLINQFLEGDQEQEQEQINQLKNQISELENQLQEQQEQISELQDQSLLDLIF